MHSYSRVLQRRGAGFIVACALAAALSPAAVGAGSEDVVLGERIYREGILPDGAQLTYRGAGGIVMAGRQAACIQCHRRSGMGSREGLFRVPPITGPVLYSRPAANTWPQRTGRKSRPVVPPRHLTREAYDDELLLRAVRTGLDSAGRQLNELMPRYFLDERSGRAIVAYLRQLSAEPVPGVEDRSFHLATVVTPDAGAARSRTVVQALTRWAERGGISRMATPLQVWRLEGPEATWGDQLRSHYRQQPVFAVISGAGGARWQPVRDFCEEASLPCLFPVVDSAPSDPADFYTFYFSDGVPLEARMLIKHLETAPVPVGRVVQFFGDEAGEGAARLVAASLARYRVESRRWSGGIGASLLADIRPDDLVVGWLRPGMVEAMLEAMPEPPGRVLLSNRLAPADRVVLPDAWRARTRWLSFRPDPRHLHGKAVLGLVPWSSRLGIPLDEEALLAEVYAATYFFGDAIGRMQGQWNREYLVETLEAAVDSRPAGSAFYDLSLGPGQRIAAKGGHLLGYLPPAFDRLAPLSPRIVP